MNFAEEKDVLRMCSRLHYPRDVQAAVELLCEEGVLSWKHIGQRDEVEVKVVPIGVLRREKGGFPLSKSLR